MPGHMPATSTPLTCLTQLLVALRVAADLACAGCSHRHGRISAVCLLDQNCANWDVVLGLKRPHIHGAPSPADAIGDAISRLEAKAGIALYSPLARFGALASFRRLASEAAPHGLGLAAPPCLLCRCRRALPPTTHFRVEPAVSTDCPAHMLCTSLLHWIITSADNRQSLIKQLTTWTRTTRVQRHRGLSADERANICLLYLQIRACPQGESACTSLLHAE